MCRNCLISRRTFAKVALSSGILLGFPELSITAETRFTVDQPPIIACDAWGALPPKTSPLVLRRKPTGIVLHHTAGPNTDNVSQAHALRFARSLQQGHFDVDWLDSGHHFAVTRGGYIVEGRTGSLAAAQRGTSFVVGTHTTGLNETLIGIESEGNYDETTPPQALVNSIVNLCAWLVQQYDLNPANIWGHFNFASTLCPGLVYYRMLPDIRAAVAAMFAVPSRSALPTLQRGDWQRRVYVAQYLLKHHGQQVLASGIFDQATIEAVEQFQTLHQLARTGSVDPATWAALFVPLNQGSSNDAVRALQVLLDVPVDGNFDRATVQALGSTTVNNDDWQRLLR